MLHFHLHFSFKKRGKIEKIHPVPSISIIIVLVPYFMKMANSVIGCDTFIALPSVTADGFVIFGKNSDRPSGEVQEIIYYPAQDYKSGSKLKVRIFISHF